MTDTAAPELVIDYVQGSVPTQAEGRAPSGRPFYFRARNGSWSLHLGPVGAPADYLAWADHPWHGTGETDEVVAEGADPTHGDMETEMVERILKLWLASR